METIRLLSVGHKNRWRSTSGCWTCRVRRKKCDERHPVCDACATLCITCNYDESKPDWMDGGPKQEQMSRRIKLEIKKSAGARRWWRPGHVSYEDAQQTTGIPTAPEHEASGANADSHGNTAASHAETCQSQGEAPVPFGRESSHCAELPIAGLSNGKENCNNNAPVKANSVLSLFYLEHVLPFLFPFYQPSPLQGGRAWVLELIWRSPVVRQVVLCQSSYFFSLAGGKHMSAEDGARWRGVLAQTRDAFEMLRSSLQFLSGSNMSEHLHGAVRILASMMQIQRYEVSILSFENCKAHLNAASALFTQLLDSAVKVGNASSKSSFVTIEGYLGSSAVSQYNDVLLFQPAEQSAFRFSSALLVFDDIIASTVLRTRPRLHRYHHDLLDSVGNECEPALHLQSSVGVENWIMEQISEIAALCVWKNECEIVGYFNTRELSERARAIIEPLEANLTRDEAEQAALSASDEILQNEFIADSSRHRSLSLEPNHLATQVWSHAAFIYLHLVVFGWQPASTETRYHVRKVIELLTHHTLLARPALLRAMVWPFCVAGCFAEPEHHDRLRQIVENLQPSSNFSTLYKALEIMQNAWQNRGTGWDLAACFESQGDLVLLV